MKLHVLRRRLVLPTGLDEAWAFFSNPANLRRITPPEMGFEVTSAPQDETYAGMIITYRVRPLLRIPITWVTEITHVREPSFFVDVQRFGAYRFWHHEHHFRAVPGGVECEDIVHYALPFGLLGRIVHALFVRRQLERVFDYRERVLSRELGDTGIPPIESSNTPAIPTPQ